MRKLPEGKQNVKESQSSQAPVSKKRKMEKVVKVKKYNRNRVPKFWIYRTGHERSDPDLLPSNAGSGLQRNFLDAWRLDGEIPQDGGVRILSKSIFLGDRYSNHVILTAEGLSSNRSLLEPWMMIRCLYSLYFRAQVPVGSANLSGRICRSKDLATLRGYINVITRTTFHLRGEIDTEVKARNISPPIMSSTWIHGTISNANGRGEKTI